MIPDTTCILVICFLITGQIIADQVCNNCGIAPECSIYFNVTWPVARDYECWQLCENNINCTVATFDGSSNCRLYDCSKIGQNIGSKAYRKSSNLDCNEFEMYYFTDYEGKCPVITTSSGATSAESCLEGCLGISTCRGTTYDASSNTCLFHDNSCSPVGMTSLYKTFIERVCVNEQPACVRNQTQMCVNCRAGLLCQTTFNQNLETKPLNIDTSVIGVDSDVEQIWYFANGSSYMYIQCPYVAQQIGDTVYRATCTLDCPKFELLTLPGHRGSCSWLSTLSGGVTLEYCMSKCLDMVNCRAVTYNSNSASCNFHGCTDYAVSPGYDFIIRRCLNESGCDASSKIVQTCVNCAPGPNCHDYYQSNVNKKLETDCLTIKTSDSDSTIVHYHRSYSSCNRTQCSQVRQEIGELVYRDSCNIDCQKFEIFQLDDVGGSCDVIHTEEGGLTFHYCIEKCLDMPGCRGSTFASSTGKCEYHNCSNHTTSPGQRFMWKHCIDYEPQRDYQQICDCCAMSDLCQKFAGALVTPYPSWETCEVQFQSSESRDVIMYRTYTNGCFLMNCTMVKQEDIMSKRVFRNSPASDCPYFRLFTLNGYIGTCPIIGFHEGGVNLDYCIDKCLDMPYCRGVSHDPSQLKCFYHNCIDRDVNASYTFVKRVCMTFDELDPVKPYVQTIKNFVNKCGLPKHAIMTETNITSANLCNTTCSECDVTVYDPINEECHHSQCDRPYGLGQGTTLLRKTTNPECLHLEMKTIAGSAPNCEAFEYDEGVLNVEFCLRRCLDLPGCFSVYMDKTAFNCTYHSCTDYVSKNTIDVFSIKNCFTDCPSPTTQTCLNCKQGSLCQSFYYKMTTSNSSSCKLLCESETICKGAVYDSSSMECQLFDCAYATQQYGSIFNRKACNDDCSIYEIYMIEGYVGSCDIIPSMTEYLVNYPELCYERCLETAECRGVTYDPKKLHCYYHICDCHLASTRVPSFKFMWKYCLENVLNRTILLQTNPTLSPRAYPTSPVCKPEPIYIMPCQCSTGAFDNFTTEEIVQQLEQNLTIDARSTSANTRKLTSAEDNRPTSVAVGTIGVILLSSVVALIIALDIPNLFKLQTPINSKTKKIKNKKKKTKNVDEKVDTSKQLHVENID